MSVQNGERLVTKQDLADMYQGIRPYLGGMPEVVANKFSKGDLYSTDEKMIGQWIDGKPLYQKVVKCEELPNNTSKTYDYDISNVDKFVSIYAVGINRNDLQTIPIPYIYNNASYTMFYWVSDSIHIATGTDRSSYDAYVFLQYTKTTDTAISIGSDTDYSTTEKIVGTWIDGSPVYQMSYVATFTDKPAGQRFYIKLADLTNVDYVNANGMIKFNETGEIYSVCTYATDKFSGVSDSNSAYSVWNADGSSHGVVVKQNFYNGNASGTVKVTIQYTKTTS